MPHRPRDDEIHRSGDHLLAAWQASDESPARFQAECEDTREGILCVKLCEAAGTFTYSLVCERIVVILPTELSLDVSAGIQTLARLDNVQIWDFVQVDVTRSIEIFPCDQNAL